MRKAAFLFTAALAFLFLFGLLFAMLGTLPDAISGLCGGLTGLLPIVGMLLVVIAAVVYALGQIMGMETRARGNVWATACIGGALMAFLIVSVAPPILGALFGGQVSCNGAACGGGTCYGSQFCCMACGPSCVPSAADCLPC